jgi:hypothetical protein
LGKGILAAFIKRVKKEKYSMSSFGWFPGVQFIIADVSEHTICPICLGRWNRVFRNVGNYKSDTGESPKRRHTIF